MLKPLSVSEISNYITKIFEAEELLKNVKIYGEVSGLSYVRGNMYFNLKDEQALMPCIMFGVSALQIKEGDQIMATGNLRYYGKMGKLNFYVTSAMPYGSGLLYQKFIELKNKLEKEGVFNVKSQDELPTIINNIGVITSKTGAVVHDIETVAHRRNPKLNIFVYPAKVQGDGAEQTIINGLKYFDKQKDIDVIIIARGGGSIEDLQPFNTEILAREIVKVSKCVISAVGHETDFTICDFASSIRTATPSVAGELVSKDIYSTLDKINNNIGKIKFLMFHLLDKNFEKLEKNLKIKNIFSQKLLLKQTKFLQNINNLSSVGSKIFAEKENQLMLFQSKLTLLNPTEILNKGWAKVYKDGHNIDSVKYIETGAQLKIELKDGIIEATAKQKTQREG